MKKVKDFIQTLLVTPINCNPFISYDTPSIQLGAGKHVVTVFIQTGNPKRSSRHVMNVYIVWV